MGKKKHAEHVNHERWLVSYADLLTLLFAFFVVLFASSVSDKKKTAQMAAAMQTAFTEHGVFEAHATSPPLESGGGNSQGTPAPLMEPVQTAPGADGNGPGTGKDANRKAAAAALERQVQQALAPALANGSASVRPTQDGLTISLHEAGFFGSGTADINPRMAGLLASIAASLPDRDLRIEGHTDNLPIHSGRFHSNFELSTARAAAIAEVLMTRSHISPSHFSLAGYGPFRPVTGNDTAAGRAQNRRVDIVLLGAGAAPPASLSPAAAPAGTARATPGTTVGNTAAPTSAAVGHSTQLTDAPFAAQRAPAPQASQLSGPRVMQLATETDRAAAH